MTLICGGLEARDRFGQQHSIFVLTVIIAIIGGILEILNQQAVSLCIPRFAIALP
jgi:hypothetical protein